MNIAHKEPERVHAFGTLGESEDEAIAARKRVQRACISAKQIDFRSKVSVVREHRPSAFGAVYLCTAGDQWSAPVLYLPLDAQMAV